MEYTYFCQSCDKEKTIDHKMSDSPLVQCECGQVMEKKIAGNGFRYSSSNWNMNYSAQKIIGGQKR